VSALEKSQKDEHSGHNKSHHLSGTNLSGASSISASSTKRSQSQHSAAAVSGIGKSANPLDSCPTLLRGKEREKPRQKKHSTLKKVRVHNRPRHCYTTVPGITERSIKMRRPTGDFFSDEYSTV
jgi:hypothetical protein